ncbi:hypothetical protein Dimus_038986 [Dionaea muscipula]
MGYSTTHHAYRCLDPTTTRTYISRHVVFVESTFPFVSIPSSPDSPSRCSPNSWLSSCVPALFPPTSLPSAPFTTTADLTPSICLLPSCTSGSTTVSPQSSPSSPLMDVVAPAPAGSPTAPAPPAAPIAPQVNPFALPSTSNVDPASSNVEPSTLTTTPPPLPNIELPSHPYNTRLRNQIVKPKRILNLNTTTAPPLHEPTTYKQANQHHVWRQSMCEEHNALLSNQTWILVPRTASQNVIGCKWVYRIKRNPDGTVARYKARLVAKGFHQQPGVDFSETFSPVVRPSTVRLVLTIAVTHGWCVRQLDVNNAFLQGSLSDEVYMEQPPGFLHPQHPQHVCRLQKAIYGLRQAPRAWYNELRHFLLSTGFRNSHCDTSLFIFQSSSTLIYLLVYVDDILITGSSTASITSFIQALASRFSLKDLGQLSYFLGVEATSTAAGLHLTQRKYISDLLVRLQMTDSKPVHTPLASTTVLQLHDGSSLADATLYRQTIGSLQYLSLTRPDISFAVNKLSQFMHCPSAAHWTAVKRVLRY